MSSYSEDDAFEAAVPLSQRAMAARGAPYLDGLNPAQREAVEKLDGPVLMLAGAGTGKTKALTTRIAHLLLTGTARPNEILAVTFTNKAAREMKMRVATLLGQPAEGMPWLGTFHSICVKLLRRHAELGSAQRNQFHESSIPTGPAGALLKQFGRLPRKYRRTSAWPAAPCAFQHHRRWKRNRAWRPPSSVPVRRKQAALLARGRAVPPLRPSYQAP